MDEELQTTGGAFGDQDGHVVWLGRTEDPTIWTELLHLLLTPAGAGGIVVGMLLAFTLKATRDRLANAARARKVEAVAPTRRR